MRRFVEHHGAHFVFDGLQVVLTALFIDAQKALKRKSARRQSRYRQRGNDGARARHNKHRHVVLGAQRHKVFARVGDGRHAGVGDNGARFARQNAVYNAPTLFGLVVLIIAYKRLFNAEVV